MNYCNFFLLKTIYMRNEKNEIGGTTTQELVLVH